MTTWTKINEFSENFRMGGGSFPIRKISLRFFRKFWGGKNNEFSEKGGGGHANPNEFIEFGPGSHPLVGPWDFQLTFLYSLTPF